MISRYFNGAGNGSCTRKRRYSAAVLKTAVFAFHHTRAIEHQGVGAFRLLRSWWPSISYLQSSNRIAHWA